MVIREAQPTSYYPDTSLHGCVGNTLRVVPGTVISHGTTLFWIVFVSNGDTDVWVKRPPIRYKANVLIHSGKIDPDLLDALPYVDVSRPHCGDTLSDLVKVLRRIYYGVSIHLL